MRHAHTRATALPPTWSRPRRGPTPPARRSGARPRRTADFALVRPALAEVVRLRPREAAALARAPGLSPYDALMEGYQRGVTAAESRRSSPPTRPSCADALPRAEEIQARRRPPSPAGPFPVAAQRALCRRLSARAGLDYAHARLDARPTRSAAARPTDVRITTRYDEHDFAQALMGVMHETGHALYERGLPAAWRASRSARPPAWPRTKASP